MGNAFSVRQFALHRKQPETDKQNVVFAPPWNNICGRRWGHKCTSRNL